MDASLAVPARTRGSSRAETRSSPQLALESHHTPAQAVSNTYHLQLGLGRWGVQHRSVNREKFFHSRVTNGNCLLADTFPPLPAWEVTAQFLPEEPPSSPSLASGTSAVSPDSNSRLQKSLSYPSSSLEQRGKLSLKVSKASPALALPSSPHLTSLWVPLYMRLGDTQTSQGSNSSGMGNLTQFRAHR